MARESMTLYNKDSSGYSMRIGVSAYKGKVLTHLPEMTAVAGVLDDLEHSMPRSDDVWLMSYPKSGSHWMQEIVGILLNGKLEPLKEYKGRCFIERKASFQTIEEEPSPRLISTHARVRYIPASVLQKSKLICMMRNPKSVAVSYYHHISGMKAYDYDGSFEGFYDLFMQGVDNFYGTWFEYVTEWWDAAKRRDNVLFVYYEDLKKSPLSCIQEIARFIGVKRDEAFCREVVNITSMNTMATHVGKSEEDLKLMNSLFKSGTHKLVRKGVISDWKNYFTVSQNEDFNRIYEEKMKNYSEITKQLQYE